MEDITMDELVECYLLSEVRIVSLGEIFSIHAILHEPRIGPDDHRYYSGYRDESIGDVPGEDIHKKFP
jgi:hypothetical protein